MIFSSRIVILTNKKGNLEYVHMDMPGHFNPGSVYMIFYQPKRNFISVKMTVMK